MSPPDAPPTKRRNPGLRIRIDQPSLQQDGSKEGSSASAGSQPGKTLDKKQPFALPESLQWIPKNWTWTNIRPVLRCAVAAWLSAVLFLIPAVEVYMGQASFIILISAFLSPPRDSFMGVFERETILVGLVALTWAWSCLGLRLADLARTHRDSTVTLAQAMTGEYVEAIPTVILAVFIFVGTVFLLYVRARQGPGPYLFGSILACICLDITLTTSVLLPFPYYNFGRAIIVPLGFHSAICIITSFLVFPQTVSAEFTTRLQAVLAPLIKTFELHLTLKDHPVDSEAFSFAATSIKAAVAQSEAALAPLAASARLLPSDLIYSRFAPTDFKCLQAIARRMAVRGNGMTIYFMLIDPTRDKFPVTPASSRPASVPSTPVHEVSQSPLESQPSRSVSEHGDDDDDDESSAAGTITPTRRKRARVLSPLHLGNGRSHSHSRTGSHQHHHFHNLLHNSLLNLSLTRSHKSEQAVGVFESQRYMDIEATLFKDPRATMHTQQATNLLLQSCRKLLEANLGSVVAVSDWLGQVRKGRFAFWRSAKAKKNQWQLKLDALKRLRDDLDCLLQEFKTSTRLEVLEPYRAILEANGKADIESDSPSHRYLFHCYVYQYHLMRFSKQNIEMLDEIIRLEQERPKNRIWTPVQRLFTWHPWSFSDINDDEEDPETVQGIEPVMMDDLGIPRRRDPDALPPKNAFEWVMNKAYMFVQGFGGGNALYAVKAGILTILMCIPSFIRSTAPFAYENRFVWSIVMAQLTLARFRGDTAFGWSARVMSTFAGGLVGAVMWYISCGAGRGNPYGLGAVFGVCFPFFFFARLYWPGPPMTNIIFFVTTVLVVGYSYQDVHIVLPGNPGFGIDVAWRRFVLVTAGVTAAFIFSFLPPSTTIRRYQRTLLATTSAELGAIYCAIISFANTKRAQDSQEVISSLIAIRCKLNRSAVLKTNAIYEFSLRGRWPAARYQKILELQLSISYALSHLMSVIEQMEPSWTRALLARTRFMDPNFQGDLLAVISMISTSLRMGDPLPQITPCPLVDRFMLKYHGFNVIHKEAEEDFGLPRSLTFDTLENEQYLMFCVAASTSFSIVSRVDRLMVAVKEIVGEQYHVHGMNIRTGVEMGSRTDTMMMRAPSP